MRVGFAGTPEFAQVALARIHAAGFDVPLVMTQPDRPAGRGMQVRPSPVKAFALEHELAVSQPRSLRLDGKYPADAECARDVLLAARIDVLVVAAYGLILPAWALALPARGCLNIHGSLLPRWRGAAPVQRAIEAGDRETGVTIMQMDEGLDTGDMLLAESMPIGAEATAATLMDALSGMGGRMIVDALHRLESLVPRPQPEEGVVYAGKILKIEAAIDWRSSAVAIERRLRAFDPFPGSSTSMCGERVKCWRGEVLETVGGRQPGELIEVDERGIRVACGEQSLRLTVLQRAGGKRLAARQLLQAMPLQAGVSLESGTDH